MCGLDVVKTLVLVLMMTNSAVANERPCNIETVNGCSVPFDLDVPYKKTFVTACDRHDVCYACGNDPRYVINRAKCDKMFRDNMMEICKRDNIGKDCKDYATVYFRLVAQFAGGFYKQSPQNWCGHQQVPECIEPVSQKK